MSTRSSSMNTPFSSGGNFGIAAIARKEKGWRPRKDRLKRSSGDGTLLRSRYESNGEIGGGGRFTLRAFGPCHQPRPMSRSIRASLHRQLREVGFFPFPPLRTQAQVPFGVT